MKDSVKKEFDEKTKTATDAVKCVQSGDVVYIGTCTSTSYHLARALDEHVCSKNLTDIIIDCSMINKELDMFTKSEHYRFNTFFMGNMERRAKKIGCCDFTSVNLSEINLWFKYTSPPRVAFLEVSVPDDDGYMAFGASGVATYQYVLEVANLIILQINRFAPYVFGENNKIHISRADAIVYYDEELYEVANTPITPEIQKISDIILDEISDGSCIQLGIGAIANAIGFGLQEKNNLGIHTEMMTDSMMLLMQNGNVTNCCKAIYKGKSVAAFSLGTKKLYDFLNHNEKMCFLPFPIVNNPCNIAKNNNAISINSALQIDLYGQVVADNIYGQQFSAVGGQIDYVKGVQLSQGGKSFIAVTSENRGKSGINSRIVSVLPVGTAVTTSRADVQYVVTEYGCVNLKLLTARQRAQALISIAHPNYRAELTEEAQRIGLLR